LLASDLFSGHLLAQVAFVFPCLQAAGEKFMRLRVVVLLLALVQLAPFTASAQTTPTEAAAIAAAGNDHSAYVLAPDKLAKAEALHRVRVLTDFGGALWGILSLFLILELRIAAGMRNVAVGISKSRSVQGLTFVFLFLLVTSLLSLPLDLYEQHIQNAYGLSVQGWGSWFGDQGKSFALTFVVGGLGVMLLFLLIRKFPRRWWLWLWFPAMAFAVLGIFVTPYVIDPLFNKFEPLQSSNPALVAQLEQVVAQGKGIEIPPERMFLMKASAKVTTLNAYVTGFGASKRVVVWDTSIAKATPDEILFIFGHEMGHYVLGHIVRGLLFAFLWMLVAFFLGFHLVQFLLRRYGPRWGIPSQEDWAALVVFMLVLSVIGFLSQPVANAFSRAQEHAADVYGQEVIHGIVADPQASGRGAFQILGDNSLVVPDPSPFVEFWPG
jgi:STE24 endopeptidase